MNKKSVTAGLMTFVIALILTGIIAVVYVVTAAGSRRERAMFICDNVANNIAAEIQRRDYITRMLEIEVSSSKGEITEESFEIIAEEVFDDYLDIIEITLAPDGVVSYRYPKGGAVADTEDLFKDSLQGVYSDYSKLSGVSVIMAPIALKDGSFGIILRKPIFTGKDNNEEFWGFASVTLDLSLFLSEVDLRGLYEGGYEYKLFGSNTITGDSNTIVEYSERSLDNPARAMISTVGGDFWTLEISPVDGWNNIFEIVGAFAIAVIISVLAAIAMMTYMSMKQNAKELEILSYRDALTNLNNPRSYQEHMEELSKKKLPYGLIFMDLNDFKMVNDTYGHEVGDGLLNIVAKRLQNSIREKDKAFRIGGDEFVVVIHGTHDKKFFEGVIARMRQNVARDVVLGDITLKVSISAGYARCPEDGIRFEDVVKKADDAMYYNKRMLKARRLADQEKEAGSESGKE